MKTIKGIFRSGKIELPSSPDWPDGCEVVIAPLAAESVGGMREQDWPTTPEGITALLHRWEEHEPLRMTPEEEAGLAAWRRTSKVTRSQTCTKLLKGFLNEAVFSSTQGSQATLSIAVTGVYERAREEVARGNRVGICVPVLGELWDGVEVQRESRAKCGSAAPDATGPYSLAV